jgi:hypothetical protein
LNAPTTTQLLKLVLEKLQNRGMSGGDIETQILAEIIAEEVMADA